MRMDGPKYYELVVHRKLFYTKRYNDIVKLEEYVKVICIIRMCLASDTM